MELFQRYSPDRGQDRLWRNTGEKCRDPSDLNLNQDNDRSLVSWGQ